MHGALSLAPHNIRVNAIGPGSIMTPILAAVANDRAAMNRWALAEFPTLTLAEYAFAKASCSLLLSGRVFNVHLAADMMRSWLRYLSREGMCDDAYCWLLHSLHAVVPPTCLQ